MRLSQPQQMMASESKMIDKAYGGDIIGVFDPGIFSIGDTLTTSKRNLLTKESRPLHRSTLHVCVRLIR